MLSKTKHPKIPRGLKKAMRNGNLIIFAGAGISTGLKNHFSIDKEEGLPTKYDRLGNWNRFLEFLVANCNFESKEEQENLSHELKRDNNGTMGRDKALKALEKHSDEVKRLTAKYTHLVNQKFPTHFLLLRLSNKIITTNYDNAL